MLQPKQTPKEKKNLKDATKMKNMRPTGPTTGRVKPTLGGAKNGKTIKKAANGTTTTKTTKAPEGFIDKVTRKVGNSKVKDVPRKTVNVLKRGVNRLTTKDVEDAFNTATVGGYNLVKKGVKKVTGMKTGGKIKRAKNGTSLGMKSVKAGYDKNPGVTRADIITAATKKAQAGKTLPIKKSKVKGNPVFELEYQKFKNQQDMRRMKLEKEQKAKEASYPKSNKAKSGTSMKKCKYGCK